MFERMMDIAVRCTPQDAFDHVARKFFEHHGLWDPSVTSMTKTSPGPIGAGTRGTEGRRFGPWSIESEFDVTAFEPDRRFGFRTVSGPMLEEADWTFEPDALGALVHLRLRLTPVSTAFRLMEPLMHPLFAASARGNAARMREALDALNPQAAPDAPLTSDPPAARPRAS